MKTNILGVDVDTYTFSQALAVLTAYLDEDKNHVCLTPNPEMILAARTDAALMKALETADIVVPDGIGVVIASRFSKRPIKERVAGCDLVQALFAARPSTVYLLGGKPGVCEKAKANVEAAYPGVTVVGADHGYFDEDGETIIIERIQALKPDILLVGLGFPKQEKWITAHKDELPVRLSVGVGGTLDVLAGVVKRAPEGFRKLGLEWLYRLAAQPSRAGRMLKLPLFLILVLADAVRQKNSFRQKKR